MNDGKRMKLRWQGRAGRVMRRGFRLMWAGPLIVPVLLVAAAAHASRAVIIALLVLLIVVFFIGFVTVFIGYGIIKRDMAERQRQGTAGGVPTWKPGDPPWEPSKRGQAS
jgi:hypothetical protein